jgi:hypothetical protein
MTYVIPGIACAAVLHFIYESIIAPSLRLKLRFELFALRDELRLLKIDCGHRLDDRLFDHLQASLNTLIRVLPRMDLTTLAAVKRELRTNPQVREQVEARSKVLDECGIPKLREIRSRSLQVAAKAFAVNGGGWGIYLLPLLLPLVSYAGIRKAIKASLLLSEPDLNKVAPFSRHHAASPT